jgi:hypothetical protein
VVAPLEQARPVGRDERQRFGLRARQGCDDDLGGRRGDPTEAVLLPAGDDQANALVVGDRRPRGRERDAAVRALRTALHRPGRRAPAALAQRWLDARQRLETRGADQGAAPAAREAPLRKQELEHATTVGRPV